jgi:hypothetical protein
MGGRGRLDTIWVEGDIRKIAVVVVMIEAVMGQGSVLNGWEARLIAQGDHFKADSTSENNGVRLNCHAHDALWTRIWGGDMISTTAFCFYGDNPSTSCHPNDVIFKFDDTLAEMQVTLWFYYVCVCVCARRDEMCLRSMFRSRIEQDYVSSIFHNHSVFLCITGVFNDISITL